MDRYELFVSRVSDDVGGCFQSYGIRYGSEIIEDICFLEDEILDLINTMNELELEPVHLYDVIQDFL